jgi:mannitol/fructose-specific phosphotransferase system IIA component
MEMKELMVKGTQTFLGKEIPVIEGGFGEDQKVILVKTVAEIHDEEVKRINQIIITCSGY